MNQYLEDDLRARLSQHEAVIEELEKDLAEARALCREAAAYIDTAIKYGFGDPELIKRLRAMGGE